MEFLLLAGLFGLFIGWVEVEARSGFYSRIGFGLICLVVVVAGMVYINNRKVEMRTAAVGVRLNNVLKTIDLRLEESKAVHVRRAIQSYRDSYSSSDRDMSAFRELESALWRDD